MASGAGLNRAGGVLLANVNSGATAVSSPLTGYGTLTANDSGVFLIEARDFTKWSFMAYGSGAGYGITIYGITDPLAYAAFKLNINPSFYQIQNQSNPAGITTAEYPNGTTNYQPPASSWVKLPAPSEQSGTGSAANPLTPTSPFFQYSGSLLAVRAVLTTAPTSGVVSISVEAVP